MFFADTDKHTATKFVCKSNTGAIGGYCSGRFEYDNVLLDATASARSVKEAMKIRDKAVRAAK